MFKTLLIKEWKEKALIAVFGMGVMVAFLAAFLIFGDNRDLRELIPATFLIFFFPFIGVMLGAGAFESEFRNGSWAYLLSRPVRKETIWLAKLTALLSIMAAFWLVFIGLMAVVPWLGEVVRGFRFPEILDAGLEVFPLILLSSVFYFSVAFSLSILSERLLSLVFGSFFLGFILQGVLSYSVFFAVSRGLLSHAGFFPGLGAYNLALVLSSLAFLCASLITFRKVDFSQPKRKAASLAKYSTLFLALSWLLSAAWPVLRPGPKEKIESGFDIVGGGAFFSTTKGLYRYDIAGDKLRKLAGWRLATGESVIRGDKVLYAAGSDVREGLALRVMNSDGSDKKLLVKAGEYDWFYNSYALSPDGKTAMVVLEVLDRMLPRSYKKSLWSVRTDGTGMKKMPPLDRALDCEGERHSWLWLHSWLGSSDKLLLLKRSQGNVTSLWTYNLTSGAQARILEAPRVALSSVSPGRDVIMVSYQMESPGPVGLALFDIESGERMPVMTIEGPGPGLYTAFSAVWQRRGDRVAFIVLKDRGVLAPAVYSLSERRVVVLKDMGTQDATNQSPSLGWTGAEAKLVMGIPQERALKIFGDDQVVEKVISVPAGVGKEFRIWGAGDSILVQDYTNVALWRLDLQTEKWKRIW